MTERTERRGGLGRGLAALIPTGPPETDGTAAPPSRHGLGNQAADVMFGARRSDAPAPTADDTAPTANGAAAAPEASGEVAGAVYREVRLSGIRPNPKQPRTVFDEEALGELEHSIREFGLLQPIVVRELPEPEPGVDGGPSLTHELVMGERRWRAAQKVGLEHIPAIVRRTPDDTLLRDALLENIHRVQLNPLEEAAAYQQLLTEFDVTHEQLADRIGRSRPAITNTIRLLRLPVAVQRRVAAGVLSAGHARALLGLEDAAAQEELAARIVAEGMSVRAAEEAVTLARGGQPPAKRAPARRPMHAPGLQDLAERLSDTFDTRVKVELGQRKGRIVVEFGSVDDLERIARLMGPDPSSGPPPRD
ncbi:ParB family chromosome partitioning protein [Actinomycetospora succinea]|uniref:ParB family chromosome partitioning protein n=1 Tax=Actinomycetospora succinea TaxID=663603 RepID=A0A4V3DA91_9PSEU|nr:ParB/RepB/Spo0J family partition protein [Actinomycetospora succinea]TDQ61018.1 ParB family chromosome partitioning protein [Actinomycetospora succinea]